eukprot:CAMPEP_0194369570 /NCGR_PEP_ID=MMETSP0174-20130528/17890_1 /TAXON_ID=216777 /ORGANISM="Proboscia alata, Strain PI-D3" /LENGTH=481 /DNA_ID=CAMNT_0039146595 /DNA_START=75 /DNA_END=1520 /DNA_ORIENTATION=+
MTDVNASPTSISEEIDNVKRNYPKVKIQTATSCFMNASYQRTASTHVRLTLTFPEGYPSRPLIVDVAPDEIVPNGLKKKLDKELRSDAEIFIGQHEQIGAVFNRLTHFIDSNKFVPCWKELRQCVELVNSTNSSSKINDAKNKNDKLSKCSTIIINDKKGKISLKLHRQKYYYSCSIIIDDNYPSTARNEDWGKACLLTMGSTNFPPKIEKILTGQAKELVRRMQDGMSTEAAMMMSNPMKAPEIDKNEKALTKVRITKDSLKGLKRDTETLSIVRSLREVDSAVCQGNATIKANSKKERKDARRTVSKITEREILKDKNIEANDKQWRIEEQERINNYNMSKSDGKPQKSLFSLVRFLSEKIQLLPDEKCPVCTELTLPQNPDDLSLLYDAMKEANTKEEKKARKEAKQICPIRTHCGCWYHYRCLDTFMTEPPFGDACLTINCGRRVYHPNWPSSMVTLERVWANKEARKREIEDMDML